MAKFFNSDIADLSHQLTLSPRRLRVEQIQGIDKLLGLIDPAQAYPFDMVCYLVTNYRKRGSASTEALIPGKALISDLVTMAEMLTRGANLARGELIEPCLTQHELAEELQVSTKTIRRWRSRGLMGIRLVYEDGVNRLAFCRGTIDRFVSRNKDLVEKGAAFKQLTATERKGIVDRAREILAGQPLKLQTVARAISDETGRAVETVRYTLRRHDESNASSRLFTGDGSTKHCERYMSIWRCWKTGEAIDSIARAFDCSAEEIEGVIRRVQVEQWQQSPPACVHSELFDAPNADALILEVAEPESGDAAVPKAPKDLPPYLRSLYLTPLLSREQEQDLFRRYNYLKCKAAGVLRRMDMDEPSAGEVELVRNLLAQSGAIKQRIIRANLRLVVSIAKRHVGWSANFFEVISDGNVSLMRAVENFDYARGNKFSTYATWAIVKNYARSIPEQHYHCTRFVTGQDALLDTAPDRSKQAVLQSDRREVQVRIAAGLSKLSEREREIVSGHFGLSGKGGPVTLEQLGKRFGVTKERIRQIEQRALAHLREMLAPSLVDAISD